MSPFDAETQHKWNAGLLLIVLLVVAVVAIELLGTWVYYGIALHLAAIPALAYPLVYMKSPWRDGNTGVALMNKARAVAIFFVIAIVSYWRPFQLEGYFICLALTYLGWAISYQFSVMLRLKRRANKQEAMR